MPQNHAGGRQPRTPEGTHSAGHTGLSRGKGDWGANNVPRVRLLLLQRRTCAHQHTNRSEGPRCRTSARTQSLRLSSRSRNQNVGPAPQPTPIGSRARPRRRLRSQGAAVRASGPMSPIGSRRAPQDSPMFGTALVTLTVLWVELPATVTQRSA